MGDAYRTIPNTTTRILKDGSRKTFHTVRHVLIKPPRWQVLTPDDMARIRQRVANGETKTKVARELGMGIRRIDKILAAQP